MGKIFNWLIGNKIKTYLYLGILVVIGGYISYHVINYKTAIRDAGRFKIERDKVIIDNTELKSYNTSLLLRNDSINKVIVSDKVNYDKTIKETQGIIAQQRLIIKNKDKLINDMSKNLKCKNIFGKIVDC